MLTFLAPLALTGLGLLAIPVVIHLLRPRRVRVVPFSSLRWLRASQHRLTRRIQWHQILLFLLRAGFLTALVLALARPVFSRRAEQEPADRLIVVDTGPAMDYRMTDKPRPLETAREAARALAARAVPGGRTVLLAGGQAFDSEMDGPAADRLQALEAGAADIGVTETLRGAAALIEPRRPGAALDVYIFTSPFAAAWSRHDLARFLEDTAPPVRVHVLAAGPERPQNAWIREARLHVRERPARRFVRVQVAAAGDGVKERVVRLTGAAGLPDMMRPVSIPSGGTVEVEFDIPAGFETAGQTAMAVLEPADEMPHDDRWWLALDPRADVRVLVLEPETTQIAELQPGFHLRQALEALSDDRTGLLRVTRRAEHTVRPADVDEADVVFLADVPRLPTEVLDALEKRVAQGIGLAVFAGPSLDLEFYRTRLFDPLRPSTCLLPAPPGEPVEWKRTGRLARLTGLRDGHPLFRGMTDPMAGDWLQAVFFTALRFETPAPGQGDVLAAFEDAGPAILARSLGAGRVLVFNLTANDAWSDLPRRPGFVPLMDRTLDWLAGALRRGAVEAGQPAVWVLGGLDAGARVTVTGPDGRERPVETRPAGGRTAVQTARTDQPGVYTLFYRADGAERRVPLVVQAGRRSSSAVLMDEAVLKAWWAPASCEIWKPDAWHRRLEREGARLDLDSWLMAAAFLLLLAETILANRACPRANPRVASESVVARDGFFRPREETPR